MQELLETVIENNRIWTKEGKVATYIPELAKANPDALGIYIVDFQGNSFYEGDYETKFTIQSVSKVITLICALIDRGKEKVFSKVGSEPSSDSFNSMVKLETRDSHTPLNPFINAGAIVTTSLVSGDNGIEKFDRVHAMMKKMADNDAIQVNYDVYKSEKLTGNTNRAIAYYLKGAEVIERDVEDVLDTYFKLCSIEVTVKDVSMMASVIANGGVAPWSNERLIPKDVNQIAQAIMMTCGLYNASGEYAVKIGVPSKSGVGGCIMAVVPKKMGIAVVGPALDERGNSVAGTKALEELSQKLELSIF
ncbi:glutaminase A [Marinisporobacter balticus]|uniref:Glutaminase n=1 Tax=Marinisporobacter balticus TaxID=2018667 RepID=A0A4R2LDK4_9FIRM|nr:glutaminase A [Marinisporobacter balticus]TCO77435.1 L-glutaminase [Marinisporobacter balticus]